MAKEIKPDNRVRQYFSDNLDYICDSFKEIIKEIVEVRVDQDHLSVEELVKSGQGLMLYDDIVKETKQEIKKDEKEPQSDKAKPPNQNDTKDNTEKPPKE